jgi:UDP-N-acetylmuramate dehydrogenase
MHFSAKESIADGPLQYSIEVKILENVSLAPYTTLGVGGAARWFVETGAEDEVLAAVRFARAQAVPLFLLGGGSNLLVADEGFGGVVVRLSGGELDWIDAGDGMGRIVAGAGVEWDAVVRLAMERNGAGVECLAGIPGSVGAAPVQNVGAYGQDVSHTIAHVRALDLQTEQAVELSSSECGFSYRRSIFNSTHKGRYAITRVEFALCLDQPPSLEYRDVKNYFAERDQAYPTLAETADAVRKIRRRKGMMLTDDDPDTRSAGSFFKNPVARADAVARLAEIAGCRVEEVPQFPAGWGYAPEDGMVKLSAAWLIESAGFGKGFAMGRAALSSKHVLAIVNRGGATSAEIVALRNAVIAGVERAFAVRLEQEPVLLGFPPR